MNLKKEERESLEEELVEKLGRTGYCSVASRVIYEFRPDTSPWVITDSETKKADIHFFLFDGQYALDIWGIYPLPTLLEIIDKGNEGFIAEPIEWRRMWQHERNLRMCAEEKEIVERRFRQHISKRLKTFGVKERQGK